MQKFLVFLIGVNLFIALGCNKKEEKEEANKTVTKDKNTQKETKAKEANTSDKAIKGTMYFLTDKRCKKCKRYEQMIGRLFKNFTSKMKGLKTKIVYYGTPEGKKLYKDSGKEKLPVILFSKGVQEAEFFKTKLKRAVSPAGKYVKLKGRQFFDPTAEICDNSKDDTGNGKVDCDDPSCKNDLACREEIKGRLDVFVMSQCPYGVKGLDAMKEVLQNTKDIDFHINYIAQKQGNGFKALHGQPEVDENIRQLCAIKNYPKDYKYMDYIWCRNKNYKSNKWKSCAKDDIKAEVIEKCFKEEGNKLLEENIKKANKLGIGASPSWITNNRYKFSGISPEKIKKEFCKHNKDYKICDKKLSGGSKVKGSCG
ncbi:MAG: hypothetical protein ACQES9_01165 [Myxococcota bacterium]